MTAPLIRHGTVARLRGRIMASSATTFGPEALDTLDFEFEVLTGRHQGARFWESYLSTLRQGALHTRIHGGAFGKCSTPR